jgi:GntR family transcriptional regulator, rspAB operon transcriptional repressor
VKVLDRAATDSLARKPRPRALEGAPSSLAERAYDLLVRKITRLEAEPGSVLVERELMEDFGIGRTPVREATQRLAIERLVNHLPKRGMFVSEITATSVQQIYEFRLVVDGQAAWLAASRATTEQIRALALLHEQLVRATEDDDIDEYVSRDRQFYRVLADAAHNTLLADSIPRVFNLHLRLWFFISRRIGGWHDIAQAHEVMTHDVVAALGWRDQAKAKSAMEAYVTGRLTDMKKFL